MRITLYRADIEAAVRAYITGMFGIFADKPSITVTSGDGVIQVDVGEGPPNQDGIVPSQNVSSDLVKAVLETSGRMMAGVPMTSTLQSTPGSVFTGIFNKKAEQTPANNPAAEAVVEVLEDTKPGPTEAAPEVVQAAPVEDKLPDTNDNVVQEEEVQPVRKVQSLFKNLRKPVNG